VVLLSHNGMDVDLKLASRVRGIDAILGGHTHDGVPAPCRSRTRAAPRWSPTPARNGKFLGVHGLRGARRQAASDWRYRLLPVFADLLPGRCRRWTHSIDERPRARTETRLAEKLARHRWPALPARQLQRQLGPADPAMR
jgi:sulfur-oxidizing protein SoxB